MKKFATLAVLAVVSGSAYTQSSSVTLFGIIDEAARCVKNGDLKQKSLVSAGIDSGRLGGRGVEGPGDGLKAGFWLETGLNADNGGQSDPTRFWNRRSTVSLMGNFGELSLGRDFTPTHTGIMDLHRGTASVISGAGRRTMFRLGFPGAGGADRARLARIFHAPP